MSTTVEPTALEAARRHYAVCMACRRRTLSSRERDRRGINTCQFCCDGPQVGPEDPALDREFLAGPDGNCPAGRWAGAPVPDHGAARSRRRERLVQRRVEHLGPLLEVALEGLDTEACTERLEALQAAGLLDRETRERIEDGLRQSRS